MSNKADDAESKRGKVTPENLEEAQALKRIWDEKRKALGLTQESVGAEFKIGNQAAVGHFLLGRTALSLNAGVGFAKALHVPIGAFSPRLEKEAREVASVLEPEPLIPGADLALKLAVRFAELPEQFDDKGLKSDFYKELVTLIVQRPHRQPDNPNPAAAGTSAPRRTRKAPTASRDPHPGTQLESARSNS